MLCPGSFNLKRVLKLIESSRVSFINKFSKDSGLHLKTIVGQLIV
jgi:hypothetical protein